MYEVLQGPRHDLRRGLLDRHEKPQGRGLGEGQTDLESKKEKVAFGLVCPPMGLRYGKTQDTKDIQVKMELFYPL